MSNIGRTTSTAILPTAQHGLRHFHTDMIQTGDWGHWVGREMGSKYTDSCKLSHFNLAHSPLPESVEYTQREQNVQDRVDDWLENHMGYAICMRTRPHTIGFGFNDNPMGILTWVGEKYNEAADPEKQKLRYRTQCILTTASLYYFTNCITPSRACCASMRPSGMRISPASPWSRTTASPSPLVILPSTGTRSRAPRER
jgi:hypothetical protein